MFSSSPPYSSPLARRSIKAKPTRMYQPSHSSPLSPTSSPTSAVQNRRKQQYKSQSSSYSLPKLNIPDDTPHKQFLRERFKARCLERAKESRARAVRKYRGDSTDVCTSSDVFDMEGDFAMEEDGGDDNVFDDEIYKRVMLNEIRRSQHAKRVSFERDFGSSIDPAMYEDMETLELDLTGQKSITRSLSPPPDVDDDDLIQEYLAELGESEWNAMQQRISDGVIDIESEDPGELEREFREANTDQPSPSRSMYSSFTVSSPPSSPSQNNIPASTTGSSIYTQCPFCTSRTPPNQIACSSCTHKHSLHHAQSAWFDIILHSGLNKNSLHIPLIFDTPNESGVGVVMLCAAPGCDWCFAL